MQIVFILSHPAVAENVGASARALKTMGFEQLRIINSKVHHDKQARLLAHGSTELLRDARCYDSLSDAVGDCDLVIGTSAKARHQRETLYLPSELKTLLSQRRNSLQKVAIVFGCEQAGLSNEELTCCDILTSIPLAVHYPSLNLSQAVMLYAYELSAQQQQSNQLKRSKTANASSEKNASEASLHRLQDKIRSRFDTFGIHKKDKVYPWAIEKIATLNNRELGFLHFICDKLDNQ